MNTATIKTTAKAATAYARTDRDGFLFVAFRVKVITRFGNRHGQIGTWIKVSTTRHGDIEGPNADCLESNLDGSEGGFEALRQHALICKGIATELAQVDWAGPKALKAAKAIVAAYDALSGLPATTEAAIRFATK